METSPQQKTLEVECSSLNEKRMTSLELKSSPGLKAQIILKPFKASSIYPGKDKTKIICDYIYSGYYCTEKRTQCSYCELSLKDFE